MLIMVFLSPAAPCLPPYGQISLASSDGWLPRRWQLCSCWSGRERRWASPSAKAVFRTPRQPEKSDRFRTFTSPHCLPSLAGSFANLFERFFKHIHCVVHHCDNRFCISFSSLELLAAGCILSPNA